MNTITIPMNILASATHFAGVKDIRPALNGVNIAILQTRIHVTATDGHMFGMYKWDCETPGDLQGKNFTIHVDALKPHLKGGGLVITVVAESGTGGITKLRLDSGKAITEVTAIDSQFPSFQRLIPNTIDENAGHAWIPPALLARADKAGRVLKGLKKLARTPLRILHNGAENLQPIVYEDCDDFYGGIMPLRKSATGAFMTQTPDWVKEDNK